MHVVDPNSSWAINANGMAVRRSPEADDLAHVARGSTHAADALLRPSSKEHSGAVP